MRRLYLYLLIVTDATITAQLPAGFSDELFSNEITTPVGIAFPDSQLIYIWEQDGIIEIFEAGKKVTTLLNLSEEVSGTADHGLLGFALHPDFRQNGYIYLAYVVDPHYLRFYGTPEYNTQLLQSWDATIARVTRYQVDTSDFTSVIDNSRTILVGESLTNGIPVLAPGHGIGGLDFGTDGTLLIGTGDGTTWVGSHTGGINYKEFGFDSMGKVLGIIDSLQDYGSLRAQLLDSYSGKILRIDPLTGLGIASNPFYDPVQPQSIRSKVWSLGLRNPFRIRVKPGSGEIDPLKGNPGVIFVGDVGGNQFEELNVVTGPAQNFGWPLYEGMLKNHGFYDQGIAHPHAPNLQSGSCEIPYYRFNDLITDARKDHQIISPDPCDTSKNLASHYQVFIHSLPVVAYGNTKNNPLTTHIPYYSKNGIADFLSLEDERSPVTGQNFDGISSVTGDFYESGTFPEEYTGLYFHADFGGWIRTIEYYADNPGQIKKINPFLLDGLSIVFLKFNPFDQALYYVVLDYRKRPNIYEIRKISFSENPRPRAVIDLDTLFGLTPLTVHLSSESSFDPQGENISRFWYFNEVPAGHFQDTVLVLESTKIENFVVGLTVVDEANQKDSTTRFISLNNTPPSVKITSIEDGYKYLPGREFLSIAMEAEVWDAEQTTLTHFWEIKLKHNDHYHVEFTDTMPGTNTQLVPLSSTELDKHSYLISLTVTDPLGLRGFDEVMIEPDLTTDLLQPEPAEQIFQIYPNPTSRLLYMTVNNVGTWSHADVYLHDMFGQPVKKLTIANLPGETHVLNVSDLPKGLYILNISTHNLYLEQRKIIIE